MFKKVDYKNGVTVIYAENLNDIQDALLALEDGMPAAVEAARNAADAALEVKWAALRGDFDGKQGPPGEPGQPGEKGDPGVSFTVGTVTTGEPGAKAEVKNVGTASDPILDFTIPQGIQGPEGKQGPPGETGQTGPDGATGPQGAPGVSPTVEITKEGGTTTLTITDAGGEHTATIEDGKDGKDGKDGEVSQAVLEAALEPLETGIAEAKKDAGEAKEAAEGAKTAAASATSRTWTCSVPATAWVSGSDTWSGISAGYKAEVQAEGMTEETEIGCISFAGGDLVYAGLWRYLRPGAGKVTLFAEEKPSKDFSLVLTEVK